MVRRFLVHTEKHRETVSLLAGRQRVVLARHPVPIVKSRWEPERSSPCHLVSPGFVKAHKGYMRFLEVLARRPDWHWTVAGGPQDGADREFVSRFEERVRLLGLGSRVLLTGYLPRREMERRIARARIALFPFDHSAGSGSLTWALGAAMPVVATDIDPVKELRKAGAGIALLDRESADSWAGEIDGLLGSPSALRSLAGKNRTYSLRNGYGQLAALVADVFRQILEETGGEAP